MIEIALVEDEDVYIKTFREHLEKYIKETGEEIHLTVFNDGEEILENYDGHFNIIFLDIVMKSLDGMSTAEKIRSTDKQVILFFVTNSTQYAIRGYAVDAMDYILKPVTYFSFQQKLDKALRLLKQNSSAFLTLTYKNSIKKININDILFIESQGHTQTFYLTTGEYSLREKIEVLEEKLEDQNFFRINKGCLVNMKHVTSLEDTYCIIGETRLVVSRNKKKPFMDSLTEYLSGKAL